MYLLFLEKLVSRSIDNENKIDKKIYSVKKIEIDLFRTLIICLTLLSTCNRLQKSQ